ncbi:MAG: UDP-N-acetylmuramyl pentapeptide synthase [uncultured bacterium]|nr:MAG: UDP-N-acetylmuramyl pentapeptide synthase [uncultured bacterium]KKU25953.1 MAG: UDP-N-acetylmuramoyl-tripeptide-D-alanyl-D-alanine ligase [Microgenomates group bacterium GW2011_GWA2_46_16]
MSKHLRLALLQLEQYDTKRFLANKNMDDESLVKRISWTARLRLTSYLSTLLGIVGANMLIGTVVHVIEGMIWHRAKKQIANLKKRGLKVVAIAGSYGKTSVKNYAYDLMRSKYEVVATPESFNTVFGIAKCLEYEVSDKIEIFIVEVGAYHIGDIIHLLEMVQPDLGVLTGMARQHLERFGSWENIQLAKSEIAVFMKKVGGELVANGSDETVVQNVEKLGVKLAWYRGKDRREINLNGARAIALAMGVSEEEIMKVKIREPKNRFEMTTERYGMKVIDDSFSSNDRGFKDALTYLGQQKKYVRILVTPGLVELGNESNQIHEELGRVIVGKVDLVILVGKNERTNSLEQGMAGKVRLLHIDKTLDFIRAVHDLKLKKEPLVLLENDVTENYD